MYSRERHSFLFLPEMPTDEPHRDDDVTPRSLHSTSSRPVHCNQGRIFPTLFLNLNIGSLLLKKKETQLVAQSFYFIGIYFVSGC
jgi:hypothetical protein